MDAAELDRKMLAEREFWVEVAPGKRMKLRRPLMDEYGAYATDSSPKHMAECLRDWDGIVEADLVAGGSEQPVDYSVATAGLAMRDNIDWFKAVAKGIFEAMNARALATSIAVKNLQPS